MPKARAIRMVCHHCAVTLTNDDRTHYGYECHGCVVREHELILTWKTDPEHPEAESLFNGPVNIGYEKADRVA